MKNALLLLIISLSQIALAQNMNAKELLTTMAKDGEVLEE